MPVFTKKQAFYIYRIYFTIRPRMICYFKILLYSCSGRNSTVFSRFDPVLQCPNNQVRYFLFTVSRIQPRPKSCIRRLFQEML